jgi:hypothetical protein
MFTRPPDPAPIVVVIPVPLPSVVAPVLVRVVKAPVPGVPLPIEPGAAQVPPSSCETFRFGTTVVLVMANGEVPIASELVITPVAETVVKAAACGDVPPMSGGEAKKLVKPAPLMLPEAISVVAVTPAGVVAPSVPFKAPLVLLSAVKVPAAATVPPMAGGEAKYVLKPRPETSPEALSVVTAAVPGVVAPSEPFSAPLVLLSAVKVPAPGAVPPMAGGEANRLVKPAPETAPEALSVVTAAVEGVVAPNVVPLTAPPVIATAPAPCSAMVLKPARPATTHVPGVPAAIQTHLVA